MGLRLHAADDQGTSVHPDDGFIVMPERLFLEIFGAPQGCPQFPKVENRFQFWILMAEGGHLPEHLSEAVKTLLKTNPDWKEASAALVA